MINKNTIQYLNNQLDTCQQFKNYQHYKIYFNKVQIFYILFISTIFYNSLSQNHQVNGYPQSHYACDCTDEICVMRKLDKIPDICNTNYDTMSLIKNELLIFKDKYVWRFNNDTKYNGNPFLINEIWKFPEDDNFRKIDAVYENQEKKTIFFIGKKYYSFNGSNLEEEYPKSLSVLGLPDNLERIDAALVWGYNDRTYFYSGHTYWGFDENEKKVELYYPRDMSVWAGIGYHINAAFKYTNGKTYFFKDKFFWEFDDNKMRVAHARPKKTALRWFKCRNQLKS